MTKAFINRIATAVPPHDVHEAFIGFAAGMLPEGGTRNLFQRMARLSAIEVEGRRAGVRSGEFSADGATDEVL